MTKFKFMIEIATDIDMEELNVDYNVIQKHIKGDVEEAMRNYGLDVLNVECIEEMSNYQNIPTDEQIYELWDEVGQYFALYDDVKNTVREALNRWGTPEPTALEDREPHHTDLDECGSCWWWDEMKECYESLCGDIGGIYGIREVNMRKNCPHHYTHWLPHWAIKLPKEKNG